MSGSRRTRPRRRLSKSRSAPPSSKVSVNRSHSGLRGVRCGRGTDVVAALVDLAVRLGHQDPAAHAEVDAEHRVAGRLHPHRLAPPVRRQEPLSDQGATDLAGHVGPADPGVGVVDVDDPPVERGPFDDGARGLDLGQLRHAVSLAAAPSRTSRAAAFMAGHSPCGRRQAVRSQSRHVQAPPSLAATTSAITLASRPRSTSTSSGARWSVRPTGTPTGRRARPVHGRVRPR